MLKAPITSREHKLPTPGVVKARIVCVYDLGTHTDKRFLNDKGQPTRRHLIQIQWELDEMMEYEGEQKPMMATKRYTLSSHAKATLRKDVEGLYGKKFSDADLADSGGIDVQKLLGRPCLLSLVHSEDGQYSNVSSISPPGKSPIAEQYYPSRFFELGNPSADVWATMSQKTRQFISESEEVTSGDVILPKFVERVN